MSIGYVPPAGAGWYIGEPFSGDPSVSPGLPRPIGWEVRRPDGTGAWFKTGPLETDWTPFSDIGGGKTLAAIYTAGLAAPTADNYFPEPSGNLRFRGNSGSGGVPNVAWYETPSGEGDPRLAAWYTRRYFSVAPRIGQVFNDALVGYDPLWDGTFGQLDGMKLTVTRAGFTGTNDETSAGMAVALGDASFLSTSGFFNGPDCWPTPGLNAGQVERYVWDLWQGADLAETQAGALSGWGQLLLNTKALQHGITAFLDVEADWRFLSLSAGDGLGLFLRRSTDDPPLAVLAGYSVDGTVGGAWGWAAYGRDSGGSLSTTPLFKADWTNGFQINTKLSANGAQIVQAFEVVVDLTTAGTTTIVPAILGKQFVPSFLSIVGITNKTTTGTLTTAPNITVGDSATFDNFINAAQGTGVPSATVFNDGAGTMTRVLGGTIVVGTPGNPVVVKVATAATGTGLVWQATFSITGFYI